VGCLVDIDDLLCALRDFADPLDCPGDGDIFPCGGNGIVDVDDLLAVLSAFAGIAACPPPCPPGACIADFPGPPAGSECRDGNTTGAYFFPGGMSESDCYSAGGIYCGDFGVCDVDCP